MISEEEILAFYQVLIADWAWGIGPNGDKIPDVVVLEHKRPDDGLCIVASSTLPRTLAEMREAALAHHAECPFLAVEV